jgi:hypothetical protein
MAADVDKSTEVVPWAPVLPASLDGLGWAQLVELGRFVEGSARQWLLGDLAARVTADSRYGQRMLRKYADEIGVPYNTLREYRAVSRAWPQNDRRLSLSWSVHQAFAALDDRAELLVSRDDWTLRQRGSWPRSALIRETAGCRRHPMPAHPAASRTAGSQRPLSPV